MNVSPKNSEPKILIIDDDILTRASISGAISNTGLNVVALVTDAKGAVMLTGCTHPALLRNNSHDLPSGREYLIKNQISEIQLVTEAITKSFTNVNSGNAISAVAKLPNPIYGLTGVQIETLRMVAQGFTNSQIAEQSYESEKSVEATISKTAKALDFPSATNQNQRVHVAQVYFRLSGKTSQ